MALAGNLKPISRVKKQMNFSDWLQDQIIKSGKTRKEIAKLANMPKREMDDICNGGIPKYHRLKWIASALNLTVYEIEDALLESKNSNLEPVVNVHPIADFKSKQAPNQLKSDYKTPLQPIKVKTCVITGKPNPERAHYDGPAQHHFGKGMSQKCDNLFVAEISSELHREYHNPKEPKNIERSHDFLVAILLTIKRKAENGQIIFVK